MKPFLFMSIYLTLLLIGQILWKQGVTAGHDFFRGSILQTLWGLARSPYIISGLFIYGLATLLWLYLLSCYNLSYIYPMLSLSIVLISVVSFLFLGEEIPGTRWVGMFVICLGVYLVS
ncbi:EamA family transporter, partial [bacterium]|nr:EamA family transporter [bacterium]